MNHESQPSGPEIPATGEGPQWDPDEQVGDIYEVDIGPHGVQHIEKLRASPSIWVGSLSDYNNGVLHGEWTDAARADEEIWTDINTMLGASPTAMRSGERAEEWAIFDHENFGAYGPKEFDTISHVAAIGRGIAEHGLPFAAWADIVDDDTELARFSEAYLGEYNSLAAYAEQLVDDIGYNQILDDVLPPQLRPYVSIDTGQLGEDMRLSGDIHVYERPNGGVWLFEGT
jgi:antirestriction protein